MNNFYNVILMLLLFIISSHTLDATSQEAENFIKELNLKNNEYYSGDKLVKTSEVKSIIDKIENSDKLSDNEKLFLKIEAYTLLANTSITSQTFEKEYLILKEIYKSIQNKAFRNLNVSSEVYAAYTDFARSMIILSSIYGDAYLYIFIVDAKEYARVALMKDPDNAKARILYGMISSVNLDYRYNYLYARSLKFMSSTENMPEYMVFRTYIYRSIMYMKVNEIEKSFNELEKAKNIYPNAFFVSMLTISYANGGTGFSHSKISKDNILLYRRNKK